MRKNAVGGLFLFVPKVHDLDSYKMVVNRLITFLIVFGLCISFIAMFVSYSTFEKKSEDVNKELLINANSILQSNISEKLSILLNNQDFVSYINEGEYSRKLNTFSMIFLFNKFIDSDLISGIKVNKNDISILDIGNEDYRFNVNLNLCYLNGQINNQFGNCYADIIVFMSKSSYLKHLSKINPNIRYCDNKNKKCDKFNPFISSKFGSFSINNPSKESISIKHTSSSIYQLFIPAIIISIISTFGLLITQRLIKLLTNKYLADPIQEIEKNLKENISLKSKYIKEINYLAKEIEEYQEHKVEIELGKNLAQVAHDMRSPLLAVDSFFHLVEKKLDECERNFGRRAISRLDDIARSLVSKYKKENSHCSETSYVFLYSCIQEILSEKRMEYAKQDIEFEFHANQDDIFSLAYLDSANLKRMLSNIINNAVNAIIPKTGLVEICFEVNFAGSLIAVKDNGKGMSPRLIKEIFDNIKSEKIKTNLGLPHAVKYIEQVGGVFDITSVDGNGTTVHISLPPCETPFWCIKEYHVCSDELFVIIDDSQSVHDVWNKMFQEIQNIDLIHFYNATEALRFLKNVTHKKLVIFCDYEFFDEDINGLDILEKSPNVATKILVTSYLYNPKILKETIRKGFKILPKDLVPYFKLWSPEANSIEKEINLIFIDDEPRNTQSWEFFAKAKNLNITTYNEINEFLLEASRFKKNIPIYIDLNLYEEKDGITYAKEIYNLGFEKIYIATGSINFDRNNYECPWVTEVIEKRFPLLNSI